MTAWSWIPSLLCLFLVQGLVSADGEQTCVKGMAACARSDVVNNFTSLTIFNDHYFCCNGASGMTWSAPNCTCTPTDDEVEECSTGSGCMDDDHNITLNGQAYCCPTDDFYTQVQSLTVKGQAVVTCNCFKVDPANFFSFFETNQVNDKYTFHYRAYPSGTSDLTKLSEQLNAAFQPILNAWDTFLQVFDNL